MSLIKKGRKIMKPIIGISVNSLRDISQNDVGQIGVEGQDWQLIAADYILSLIHILTLPTTPYV